MTKEELIEMFGAEESKVVETMVLESIKPDFIRAIIKVRLNEAEERMDYLKGEGYIVASNGIEHVDWGKDNQGLCYEASAIIQEVNHYNFLLAKM